jgi:hypothetical protein
MGPRQRGRKEPADGDGCERSHVITDPKLTVGSGNTERQACQGQHQRGYHQRRRVV